MIDDMQRKLFDILLTESGLVASILFMSNIIWIGMFMLERKDRMARTLASDKFKKEVIETISSFVPILEIIKDRTERR
jgi:hypothetical protein